MDNVARDLYLLARVFKVSLQEPDLLDLTTKCIMDVIEYVIVVKENDELGILWDVENLLEQFCMAIGDDCTADQTFVRYKWRICKMRSTKTQDIL